MVEIKLHSFCDEITIQRFERVVLSPILSEMMPIALMKLCDFGLSLSNASVHVYRSATIQLTHIRPANYSYLNMKLV